MECSLKKKKEEKANEIFMLPAVILGVFPRMVHLDLWPILIQMTWENLQRQKKSGYIGGVNNIWKQTFYRENMIVYVECKQSLKNHGFC